MNTSKFGFGKILSSALLVLALVCMLFGFVTVNSTYKQLVSTGIGSSGMNTEDLIDDTMENIIDTYSDYISPAEQNALAAKTRSVLKGFLNDYSFSPFELSSAFSLLGQLADFSMREARADGDIYSQEYVLMKSIASKTSTANIFLIIAIILMFVSVVVTLILRFLGKKDIGFIPAIAGIILLVISLISAGTVNSLFSKALVVEEGVSMSMGSMSILAITAWPIVLVVLAAASYVVWIFRDKLSSAKLSFAGHSGSCAGWSCPSCGASCPSTSQFCPSCGAKRPAPAPTGNFCQSCGNAMTDGEMFCSKCGAKRAAAQSSPEPEYTFVFCQNCGTKLRVPSHAGTIVVSCPKCGTKSQTTVQ